MTKPSSVGATLGQLASGLGLGSTAGGDVNGTLPGGTVVVGIQGVPVCDDAPIAGDSLIFDGSQYCPAPAGASLGGMAPTELLAAEIFTIPDRRQALWSASIVMGAGSGISIGAGSAFIEVH